MDYYSWKHGNPEARRWAARKYPDYTFKRETVRDWKVKCLKAFQSKEVGNFFTFPRQGTPSKMSNKLTTEVNSVLYTAQSKCKWWSSYHKNCYSDR